jgi:hypothetical protein
MGHATCPKCHFACYLLLGVQGTFLYLSPLVLFSSEMAGDEHNKGLALKICVSGFTGDSNIVRRLDSEHRKMLQAYEKCPNVVMKIEEDGFQHLFDKNQEEVGAAILLSHVGRDCSNLSPERIIDSLKELHSKKILHGDARLANIVSVIGNPMWIDFFESDVGASPFFYDEELKNLELEIQEKFGTK